MQLFDAQFEVDPEKMSEDADSNLNVVLLQLMCQKFVTQITRSVKQCPWLVTFVFSSYILGSYVF